MADKRDYYEVLGVNKGSSEAEIKKARLKAEPEPAVDMASDIVSDLYFLLRCQKILNPSWTD